MAHAGATGRGLIRALACVGVALLLAGCSTLGEGMTDAGMMAERPYVPQGDIVGKEVIVLPLHRPVGVELASADSNGLFDAFPSASRDGFASAAAAPVSRTPRPGEELFDVVTVFWGTDRRLGPAPVPVASRPATAPWNITTGSVDKTTLPGTERGEKVEFGRSHVTIPKVAREAGQILRPRQIAFLNVSLYSESEDPRRHFTVGSLEPMQRTTFLSAADAHLRKAVRNPGQAFIFVHGFNTSFEAALYRTAQLAYDLEFDGVPYLYSWPSKAEETGYLYDRDSADRARRFFFEFLETVATATQAKKIHIIAHSLGTRPLLEALRSGGDPSELAARMKIDQIVLAAADIDRDVFLEITKAINGASKGTTLYASSNDRALQLSKTLARGIPRAGDVPTEGPVIARGIETSDISAAGATEFLAVNHSTYVQGGHVLADVRALLRDGVHPPDRRFPAYKPEKTAKGIYWKYVRN